MLSKEYRANPRLSQSQLKNILWGAEEFKYRLNNPEPSSDSQNIGSAVHLLLLQPHLFDSHVISLDHKLDRRTKQGKEILQEYKDTSKILLDPDDVEKVHSIVNAIKENDDCADLLSKCTAFEKVFLYDYKDIHFKSQLDAIGDNFVLDLKTTIILNDDRSIRRQIWDYLYHFQAASYLLAAKKEKYYIIFARTKPPYSVFPIELSAQLLQEGLELFDRACDIYNETIIFNPEFKPHNTIRII